MLRRRDEELKHFSDKLKRILTLVTLLKFLKLDMVKYGCSTYISIQQKQNNFVENYVLENVFDNLQKPENLMSSSPDFCTTSNPFQTRRKFFPLLFFIHSGICICCFILYILKLSVGNTFVEFISYSIWLRYFTG